MRFCLVIACVLLACSASAVLGGHHNNDRNRHGRNRHDHEHHDHNDRNRHDHEHHEHEEHEHHEHEEHEHEHHGHHHRDGPSLVAHCSSDYKRLCGIHSGSSFTDMWRCLVSNVDSISESACQGWMRGLAACKSATASLCGFEAQQLHDIRRCLGEVGYVNIPAECRTSSFYNNYDINV
ncbi:hypothetical protein DQ04_18221010 [Trypanosoma grayi]|uniref:hypothetical protein n=1 Tax=Trypanosoma grayi TaxID=71804 RepID=UPI0004F40F1F|nr:hypothetical protein DQ04_18221010 [Trypanosoma grayi]KEG05813.1 hypothetical protein DQ04_18221010 [Trypanosoma grayi]